MDPIEVSEYYLKTSIMKLKKLPVLFLLITTTITTISCEPDKILHEIDVISDSGNEENHGDPRDPED